ncbi:hypothetical protein DIS24_g12115 [Lasiodiplodia hormozganensis]|uniref:BZIP domain-containing protein n=1 Tax=Lasiodiplodia hormozganensis TaxID=869390 RepID=A0AA39WAH6_9PEZI|nr:hypothetical protein DIS24_g12115 [Lasiodiplodia hormozganensis]
MSQQAFRQRQTSYIKDLERRLERAGQSENEQIAKLEAENQRLRKQLTSFINKLASAQASLQHLSRLMQSTLDESGNLTDEAQPSDATGQDSLSPECGEPQPSATDALNVETEEQPADLWQEIGTALVPASSGSNEDQPEWMNMLNLAGDSEGVPEAHTEHACMPEQTSLSLPSQMPGIWSYNYQMGPPAYSHAIACSPLSETSMKASNSMCSDHITAIRACIWNKWAETDPPLSLDKNLHKLDQFTSIMFSMWNGLTRPDAMPWYTPTRWYKHLSELVTWQLNPTREMYARLHPKYRPSALQITESYPTFIDWCPFQALRDKLIIMHAANPRLDEIILDIASMYCVEVDLSKLVRTYKQPTHGYVHVWEITQVMGDEINNRKSRPDSLHRDEKTLPAPDTTSLFQSASYMRQTFQMLRMDDGASVYKLDPVIFERHPELYSPDVADLVASGTRLEYYSPQLLSRIPPPVKLNRATLRIYRHFAEWALDVICT